MQRTLIAPLAALLIAGCGAAQPAPTDDGMRVRSGLTGDAYAACDLFIQSVQRRMTHEERPDDTPPADLLARAAERAEGSSVETILRRYEALVSRIPADDPERGPRRAT